MKKPGRNNNPVYEVGLRSFQTAYQACKLDRVMKKNVEIQGSRLSITGETFDLNKYNRIFLGGVGLAASDMARWMYDLLGDRISRGILLVPPGTGGEEIKNVPVREVTSPLVDDNSRRALADLLFIIGSAREDDLVILLLTKGTAEMLEMLPDDVSFADYNLLLKKLRQAGAYPREIEAVQKHLSKLKGGRFLEQLGDVPLIVLILSDQPGGDIFRTFQSPTFYDPTTFSYCRQVLIRYNLPMKLPPHLLNYFNAGLQGKVPETLKRESAKLDNVYNFVIHNCASFAADALNEVERRGYSGSILTTHLYSDPLQAGRFFGAIMRDIFRFGIPLEPPCGFIASGRLENSENNRLKSCCLTALALALEIEGITGASFCAGTSFQFEEHAGVVCVATHETASRIRQTGVDPVDLLRKDPTPVFKKLGMVFDGAYNPVDCGDLFIMTVE